MAKINIVQFSTGPVSMFVIDDKGRIWRKALDGDIRKQVTEIPEEPA